jgi:hypothetical protein
VLWLFIQFRIQFHIHSPFCPKAVQFLMHVAFT